MEILWNILEIFDKFTDRDYTMFVSLDFFIYVIGLEFGKKLYDSSLKFCLSHEDFVVWSDKPFFTKLNSLYRLHSESNLIILFCHELASVVIIKTFSKSFFKNQDISLLFILNLIQNF